MSNEINMAGTAETSISNQIDNTNLADLVFAVMAERANLIEDNVKTQIEKIKKNNENLQKLHDIESKLKGEKPSFMHETDGGKTYTTQRGYYLTETDKTFLEDMGITVSTGDGTGLSEETIAFETIDSEGDITYQDHQTAYVFSNDDQGDDAVSKMTTSIEEKTSSISTTSQMDMATLQSTMGKYNNTYDALSNFINKYSQSVTTIISNLRS